MSNWINDPAGFDPNGWFYNTTFSSEPSTIAPDLEPTYADEWIVGIERELTRRTSIGLTYVNKETSDIFEDTCNGNLPTPAVGADCDYYVMANLPGLARDYSGFILDFESRFADWIHVLASYTHSESEGNVGYTQNAGIAFDIYPDHFDNTYGYLGDHRKHRFKANGYVDLPLDFTLGFEAYWSSPGVYTPTEASETYGRIFTERRGSRRTNDNYGLHLQAAKGFNFGRDLRFELIASVFNVFDDEQVGAPSARGSKAAPAAWTLDACVELRAAPPLRGRRSLRVLGGPELPNATWAELRAQEAFGGANHPAPNGNGRTSHQLRRRVSRCV